VEGSEYKNTSDLNLEEAKDILLKYRSARDKIKKVEDPLYDLIMHPDLAKNIYPKETIDKCKKEKKVSLCCQMINEEIFNKYKDIQSSGPSKWTIAKAINTGVM